MFEVLRTNVNMGHAPEWMQELWNECATLKDELVNFLNPESPATVLFYANEFRKSSFSYIKLGLIAQQIRAEGEYLDYYASFTTFCKKWLGKSVWAVDRLIRAADLAVRLMKAGFTQLPANEAQCRELLKLNWDDLKNVWSRVIRFIPEEERTVTAIKGAIARLHEVDPTFEGKPEGRRIAIDADYWEILEQKAKAAGLSPKRYMELLLQKDLMDGEVQDPEPAPEKPPEPEPKPKSKGFGGFRKIRELREKGFAPMVSEPLLPNPLPKSLTTVVGDRRPLLPQPYE